ncbi:flagellin [Mangrovicoccus sp. HB161399]|uniref:flagellin N-terminal helical domain-containing protein n=1 Tax=Mangrovicoccus sp. HB161399 TaxID=2720392 RepID=UPI001556CB67|nr:flagellin [Mangrovicoccus sp. HB161399]
MSSILTNTSSMVALQTLKTINSGLEKTQGEIATGKKISSAKDNSAIWAISKVMESDVNGFKAISDSLSLGESTVAVAQTAAETITDLLGQIKAKVVAAQGDNVDRTKLNNDITALKEQISSVVGAAQFNGLNLVDGSTATTNVLSSVDRDNSGAVSAAYISVSGVDLGSSGYTAKSVFGGGTNTVVSGSGDTFVMSLDSGGGSDSVDILNPTYDVGESISITIGNYTASYTVSASDIAVGNTPEDIIATNLKSQIESFGISGLQVDYDSANPGQLVFTNSGSFDLSATGQFGDDGSGGLAALATINATSSGTLAAQLVTMESLIGVAIDAASSFGSDGAQIATQSAFVSKLTDSMTAGIGAMVDANMEEASARLQALQVQQQLGIQALSIANQAPQNILALFR